MSVDARSLRERKKERTRRTIRDEAFRLFREQGYAATTIDQIAAAAEVSPSTFFRYFPTKEQLVTADDLDPLMIEALDRQPPEVPPFTAMRIASEEVFAELPQEDLDFERERQALMTSIPELRRAVLQELLASIDMIAGMLAKRTGRPVDDFEVRAAAGAMSGAVIGVLDRADGDRLDNALRALRVLEDGLTLGREGA